MGYDTLRGGAGGPPRRSTDTGFTLIELLIVIAIIGVLASLITMGIGKARAMAKVAQAQNDISVVLVAAIEAYDSDLGFYPAYDQIVSDDDLESFNAFPELYEAICGESEQAGPNSPYAELKPENTQVKDDDTLTGYRRADRDELYDSLVPKYYIDPWGEPYIYRENRSKKKKRSWMIRRASFDLWSVGPDGENQACYGIDDDEEFDDIGNW